MSIITRLVNRWNNGKNSAAIAKERLQIIVSHERNRRMQKDGIDLQELQQKLIDVIAEYLHIDKGKVTVELERDKDRSILELNVTLPDNL